MMWFCVVCVLVAVTEVVGLSDMAAVIDLKRKFEMLRRERDQWQIERPEPESGAHFNENQLGAFSFGYAEANYNILGETVTFNNSIGSSVPESPSAINPFYLFHRPKGVSGEPVKIKWDADKATLEKDLKGFFSETTKYLALMTHGFGGDSTKRTIKWIAKNLLSAYKGQAVVVLIDWKKGAAQPAYWQASSNVQLVSLITVKLVKRLMTAFPVVKAENIHFVGFSLGAHMAGYFARQYFEETKERIGQITSLDAAWPIFEDKDIMPKKGDAKFVEALHTSGERAFFSGKLGIQQSYADVDYYPNGGVRQPGCMFYQFACSHVRSAVTYALALQEQAGCLITGRKCKDYKQAVESSCPDSYEQVHFQLLTESSTKKSGVIHFKTSRGEYYCERNPEVPES